MKLIDYFIKNTHLNHTILIFLIIAGIFSYNNISKEIFPDVQLNKIMVKGYYAGASGNTLDKMAVKDLENQLSTITGLASITSVINPGRFSIIIELDEDVDKISVLSRVKDGISAIRKNLPSDMDEPTAEILDKTRGLIKYRFQVKRANLLKA